MQYYIITTMCDVVLVYIVSGLFLLFLWCPCMAIDVNVQYNGAHVANRLAPNSF